MTELIKSKAYEWRLVIIFFFGWGFIFLDRLAVVYLTPTLIGHFALNNTQVGLIGTVTTGCYAAATIIFGILATKMRRPKMWLLVFTFATALFALLCAFVQTYNQLLIVRGLIGAMEGPISPLILVLVSKAASDKSFGLDVGIINLGVAIIGISFGAFAVTQMLKFTGWQMAFLIVSLPSFIVGICVWFFAKEVTIEVAAEGTVVEAKPGISELLKYKNVILCGIIAILSFSGYWGLMIFAPVYLTQLNGMSPQSMGVAMSIWGLTGMVYAVGIPRLSDYWGRKPIMSIFIIVALVGVTILAAMPGTSVSTIVYVAIGGMIGAYGPLAWNIIPIESVPDYLKASSCGIILGLGEILGGAVFPYIGGRIADAKGLPTMMGVMAVLLLISLVLSFFMKETLPTKVKRGADGAPINA